MSEATEGIPAFLGSYIEFRQHIETLYNDFPNNVQKGREFSKLVKDTLSSRESFFGLTPQINPKESHDEGVDIFWLDPDTKKERIYCESKYRINKVDILDTVLAKFSAFEYSKVGKVSAIQPSLLDLLDSEVSDSSNRTANGEKVKYCVVTLWDLTNILKSYKDSQRPSVKFYNELISSERLEIIDGERLYELFREAYRKEYGIPQEVQFKSQLTSYKNVYTGILSAVDLIEIYKKSGNGIFFENVRDFLGLGNSDSTLDINDEIYRTAREEPDKMLERNNGITFKATSLKDDEGNIVLSNAGIINGCQTTLCIFKAKPTKDCYVPVKIVITTDDENTSNIAKTANTQNKIEKINLELSEFIRPQLVKMALAEIGLKIDLAETKTNKLPSAPLIVASIYKGKIFKSDLRFLFIGLFSKLLCI